MNPGILCALAAAALFGASTPFAKNLIGDIPPIVLAGLLYACSGVGLSILLLVRLVARRASTAFAWPVRGEWGPLLASIVFGGMLGPVLLMLGLAQLAASTASLLLNLETVFHGAYRVVSVSREFRFAHRSRHGCDCCGRCRAFGGPREHRRLDARGAARIAACLCWALDNNLTRKISASDALVIAGLKGVVAGGVNLSLAAGLGYLLPGGALIAQAAAVGFLGYGLSLALFVIALRQLGASRNGAYFAIAPFFGGVLAVAFGDPLTLQLCAAAALMGAGVWLHVAEKHEHEHLHDTVDHIHAHRHDDHHQHVHDFEWDGTEPHTHRHRHAAFAHRHAHFPDVHPRRPHR